MVPHCIEILFKGLMCNCLNEKGLVLEIVANYIFQGLKIFTVTVK